MFAHIFLYSHISCTHTYKCIWNSYKHTHTDKGSLSFSLTHSHTRTHTHTFMTSGGSSWERRKLLIHTNEDTKSGRKLKTRRRKIGFIFGVHAGVFIYRNWVMTKNTRSEEGVRWKCLSPDYCDQFLHYLYIPKILEFLLDNVGLKSNSEVLLLTISCYIKHLHHCISGANTVLVTLK